MHLNARLLFREHVVPLLSDDHRVLEMGPDLHPSTLQVEAAGRYARWETADLVSGPPGDLTYPMSDADAIPAPSGTFDVVVSSSVIEHVRRPWIWFAEIARVCRPGGLVATISPISWPEHKNEFVPYDCWRIFPDGMRVLAEDAGLVVELCEFKTLEANAATPWYPGETYRFLQPPQPRLIRSVTKALDTVLRRPRSAAVDCITVARKPIR